MGWVNTKSITSQREAFNTRFPNRRKASDGTIGDPAHQQSTSSHNPDDTPGSKSEYTDSDSKAEVRGIDTDEVLNDPAVDMFDVVEAIIATPNDVKRCKYLILHDTVWSRNTNWEPRPYGGAWHNHLHGSLDPLYDEDGSPWLSILNVRKSNMAGNVWDEPIECGKGETRTARQMFTDFWNAFYRGHGPKDGVIGGYATEFPRSIYAAIAGGTVATPIPPGSTLSDDDVERVAERVVALMSAKLGQE